MIIVLDTTDNKNYLMLKDYIDDYYSGIDAIRVCVDYDYSSMRDYVLRNLYNCTGIYVTDKGSKNGLVKKIIHLAESTSSVPIFYELDVFTTLSYNQDDVIRIYKYYKELPEIQDNLRKFIRELNKLL